MVQHAAFWIWNWLQVERCFSKMWFRRVRHPPSKPPKTMITPSSSSARHCCRLRVRVQPAGGRMSLSSCAVVTNSLH